MSATNILQKIQLTLMKKYAGDIEVKSDMEEAFGLGFNSQFSQPSDEDDVDAIAADSSYTTNVAVGPPSTKRSVNKIENPIREAKKEDKKEEEAKTDEDDVSADAEADMAAQAGEEEIEDATGDDFEASPEDIAAGDDMEAAGDDMEAAGADMGGGDMGDTGGDMGDAAAGDPSMGGDMSGMGGDMGGMTGMGEEEEKSSSEIGRIYELKKIYTRLTSIEAYLGNESEQELLEIRNYVSQGIELFEIVSANFNSYKDKLDEVIIMYYKFLLEVYKSVKDFYNKHKNSGD